MLRDLRLMDMHELLAERKRIEKDPQYRAPLRGLNPQGRHLIRRVQDEIDRRMENKKPPI
mgnify:CR=1 FL=1